MQNTTTRLVHETVRLVDAAAPTLQRVGAAAVVLALISLAIGWSPRPSPAPIILIATPTPSAGGATHDLALQRAGRAAAPAGDAGDARGAAVLAAPAPTAAPTSASGYVAHTDQGDQFVPDNATPVPAEQPYSGPFLAPAPPAPAGQRLCTGFHDWRDFDPMYAGSPVCHRP